MRGLTAEALDELLVVRVARVQHLDCDPAAELLVLGQVHVGHAAAAELARDAVAASEEGAGEGVLCRHGRCKECLEVRDSPSPAGLPA